MRTENLDPVLSQLTAAECNEATAELTLHDADSQPSGHP
jgi:hypothetical protein